MIIGIIIGVMILFVIPICIICKRKCSSLQNQVNTLQSELSAFVAESHIQQVGTSKLLLTMAEANANNIHAQQSMFNFYKALSEIVVQHNLRLNTIELVQFGNGPKPFDDKSPPVIGESLGDIISG